MHQIIKQVNGSVSHYSYLIDRCSSIKSLNFLKAIHAQLIKVGFNSHTFLGNCCLDLYSKFGTIANSLKLLDDITEKNCVSWNICLKGLLGHGCLQNAMMLFDEMPVRDVVSWNSMMSGYSSYGLVDQALELYFKMQNDGVRPNQYTFSILMSLVSSSCHGKQIHGVMIQSCGLSLSNVVLGNSLISMYGKLGLVDYAFGVFLTMAKVDAISWNSLIWACYRSGCAQLALNQFCLMREMEHSPDQFTVSTVLGVCCDMRDLEKGKQIFAFCFKVGFFSNTIVSSAAIDLLSKCNRLEDAERFFSDLNRWDSAVCNSMISSYEGNGLGENAAQLFVLMLRENIRPTEFTFSSVLSCLSGSLPPDQGSQIHSLIVRTGMDSDSIVASSLVQMYSSVGMIDYAMKIFVNLVEKDLVSWNTIIFGLTYNGRVFKALDIFKALIDKGPLADRITLTGVLLACNYGNLVDEGMRIFSSMEKEYGILPGDEHYVCVVDMLSQAGKLKAAMDVIASMPYEPSFALWRSVLRGCAIHGDLKLAESVAERMMELEPKSSLPYLALAREYEMRGRWESVIRVRNAMKRRSADIELVECSWIGLRNQVYAFEADQLVHHGGRDIYTVLKLLFWEMKMEGYV